jgi:hypothetical protein
LLSSNEELARIIYQEMDQNFSLGFAGRLSAEQLKQIPCCNYS